MNIETRFENKRGCGYRKQGGLYLMSGSLMDSCGKLPIPLDVCPCCHAGIKPARGWTWVSDQFVADAPCSKLVGKNRDKVCEGCHPFDGLIDKFGLLWVGEKFYPTPHSFNIEAMGQGISRRITAVPNDFVVGETWVLLAHRKCIGGDKPGIFCVFQPTAIEYVVKDDDDQEKLEGMVKRGITLVRVEKKEEQQSMNINLN